MQRIRFVILLITLCASVANSQVFMIGILNQDLLDYIRFIAFQNFTLQLVNLPNTSIDANTYTSATTTLTAYDVIIGRFDYTVATICQQTNTTYFFLGDSISTFPGALLEVGTDLATSANMIEIYLSKYNINYPLRFISDGNSDAANVRFALGENLVSQCNFAPEDTLQTIAVCYNLVFKAPIKSNYIFISDPLNIPRLDTYIQQSLYSSLPFNSMVFFPMVDITLIFSKYYYCGSSLLEIAPEVSSIYQNGTLLQRNAMTAYLQIYSSLKSYTKMSSTTWINNNVISAFNSSLVLNIIKGTGGLYQQNGQLASKTTYIYAVANENLAIVSAFTHANNVWSETTGIANPGTAGAKGVVSTVYILDSTFVTEVNVTGGVVLTGFATDLLNYLLPPIQLSYKYTKYTAQPIVGLMINNTFNGMYAQIVSGAYTMSMFPVPARASYRSKLTYSNEVFDIQYSMLIRQASKTVQYYMFATPFSYLVWVAILVTIVFLSAILFFTNLISPNEGESTDQLTVSNSIFMVFGSFLVAKMLVKPNMFSTQIFYLLIWLGTLLLIASYVSNLFVVTTFDNSTKIHFTTMASLLQQKNYQWVFVNNSYLLNSILLDIEGNINSTYKEMYLHAKAYWNPYVINESSVEQFAMNNSQIGVLNDNIHNMIISLQNCQLTTKVDTTVSIRMAYVVNSSFQYFQELSNQIFHMRVSGIVDLLLTKYFATGVCPTSSVRNRGTNPFGYEDVSGVFILITIGIILSFIVATIEYILKKGDLQCQRLVKGNSLKFGQVYKAKVRSLDKEGVTVDIGRQSCLSRNDEARIYYVPKKNLISKSKGKGEMASPTEQGIMIGTTLYLKYLGNNPLDSKRKFIQVTKK